MSPTFYTDEEKEDIWTNEAKMNYFVLCKCMAFVGRYFTIQAIPAKQCFIPFVLKLFDSNWYLLILENIQCWHRIYLHYTELNADAKRYKFSPLFSTCVQNDFKTKLVHDSETIVMYDEWKAMLNVLGFKV